MNEVKIFNSEEFGDIRTVQLNNEIYFLGKDIAEALGYSNTISRRIVLFLMCDIAQKGDKTI